MLDAGDVVQGAGEYGRIKANFYAIALPLLAYDAVALGDTDMRYIIESHPSTPYGSIPVICSNVFNSSGKLFASKPYIVKKTSSGLKVGIIAVLSDKIVDKALQQQAGTQITPAAEVLSKQVQDLRKKADVIILLSHSGEESRALANSVPGIDVIISGHSSGVTMEAPEKIGSAIYMTARSSGKYIGKLVLDIGADKRIAGFTGEYVPLNKGYQDDPEFAKLVADQDRDMEAYYATMRAQMSRPGPGQANEPHIPQPFVSAIKCRECHAGEHASWSNTGHARAFEALRKDNRQTDPDCLSCHTTGFKVKGGFTSEIATPLLKGVQCEVCHGPGVAHTRRPAKGFGAVLQSTCVQCHDKAQSPNFQYKSYLSRITHGKQ